MPAYLTLKHFESLIGRQGHIWDVGIAGSNPVTPTIDFSVHSDHIGNVLFRAHRYPSGIFTFIGSSDCDAASDG
jgi:hypothetical protein